MTSEAIKAYMLKLRPRTMFDPVSRDITSIETPAPDTLIIRLARPTRTVADSLRHR